MTSRAQLFPRTVKSTNIYQKLGMGSGFNVWELAGKGEEEDEWGALAHFLSFPGPHARGCSWFVSLSSFVLGMPRLFGFSGIGLLWVWRESSNEALFCLRAWTLVGTMSDDDRDLEQYSYQGAFGGLNYH